ncbi:MAG: Smr/MutS family protein [Rikenellaceae bacterium]
MIYPQNFEQKLGFDRLREQVAAKCTIASATKRVWAEGFTSREREITRRIELTDQMRSMLMMESGFPRGGYSDIEGIVAKLAILGSFLDVEEIVALRKSLSAIDEIRRYIAKRCEQSTELYGALLRRGEGVESFGYIVGQIDSIVDKFNQIKDSASPELQQIRRSIREGEARASKRLQQILSAAKGSGIVDTDAMISVRDGRSVIPVAAGNKRKLQGFIQDESATGKTVYIEPVEVIQINNELRELRYAERREIVRILTTFTETIRPDAEMISGASDYLSDIDMICAKALWAIENECVRPILSQEGRLEFRSARHPLLAQTLKRQHKEIVPLNMTLDRKKHILVISGPNAGGKSVCLKTTGIIQYMFQCGFLVPLSENSELPIFESIYIDIGDEQSIDNDLSTYSSHLFNMRSMVSGASDKSLVLIDEFGSGTEPVIGGAIAEAILDRLLSKGSYGVITTHYSNIKYYAASMEGIANGAMSFDVQNIRPLFKLEMGKPGSSFAIEIARKIGLPEDIIRAASDKVGGEQISLERQLREIARDKRYWEQKRERIKHTDRRVESLEQNYSEQLTKIKEERQQIIAKAKAEAKSLIAEANKQIENTIKTIRESQAEKELTKMARKEFDTFKERVEGNDKEAERKEADVLKEMERLERRKQRREERRERERGEAQNQEATPPPPPKPQEVTVGSKVRIEGQESVGEVHSIKGKKAQVAFGQILTTVSVSSLKVVSNSEFKKATRPVAPTMKISVDISSRKLNFKDNIDVRGMRAADALESVQNFIDDALMVGVGSVAILHGKGTGALKEEIRRYLATIPDVGRAVDAHADRGGSGITVVEFNQYL